MDTMDENAHTKRDDDSVPELECTVEPHNPDQPGSSVSESDPQPRNRGSNASKEDSSSPIPRTLSLESDDSHNAAMALVSPTPADGSRSSVFIGRDSPVPLQPADANRSREKFRFFSVGVLVALAAALFFSCGSFPLKFVKRVSPFEFVFIRGLMQLLMANIVIVNTQTNYFGNSRPQVKYLLARGICGSLGLCLYYWAIKNMPFSEAVVIMQSQPIYMGILAHIFLKEKLTIFDGAITIVAMAGTLMITQPEFLVGSTSVHKAYPYHAIAAICAISAAVLVAIAYVCVRRLKDSVHFTTPLIYFSIFCVVESVIALTVTGDWELPDCYKDRVLMVIVAVCAGFLGQICLMRALQIERGLTVTLVNGFQVVIAFILQAIFLRKEALTWLSMLGSLCVTGAVTVISTRKYLTSANRLFCRSSRTQTTSVPL